MAGADPVPAADPVSAAGASPAGALDAGSPRLDPLYPVNLVLTGRPCLLVGAGPVAAQKLDGLLECAASVTVVAPQVGEALRQRLDGRVRLEQRAYRPGEAAGYRLVITATDDPEVNRAVREDAEAAGVWVNSADDPANCTFTLPARLRRGPLLVTFSTGGRSPALARWLRRRYEVELGPEYGTLLDVLVEERRRRRSGGGTTEDLDWQSALDSGMLDLIRTGRIAEAKGLLQTCLSSS